jgi:hypothetical protein
MDEMQTAGKPGMNSASAAPPNGEGENGRCTRCGASVQARDTVVAPLPHV